MKLEKQVVSLDLARRLKELGVSLVSHYSYFRLFYSNSHGKETTYEDNQYALTYTFDKELSVYDYHAYNASELLEILPRRVDIGTKHEPFNNFRMRIETAIILNDEGNIVEQYIVKYLCDTLSHEETIIRTLYRPVIYDENFCDALAKTIIYLIENKFMVIDV